MFAEVNGTRLYYEISGAGRPLVLIHGSGLDTRMWDYQFDVFARAYRVIRYDARGCGQSAVPTDEPYNRAEDLKALLDHLKIPSANIIGLSMGGAIAIDFTLLFPEAIQSLILVDSRPEGWRSGSPELAAFSQRIALEVQENNLAEARRISWEEQPLLAPARKNPRAAMLLKRIVNDYSGWQWTHTNPIRKLNPQAIQRLEEIITPTLIFVGELDLPPFHAIAEVMCQRIRGARKVVLPGAGHVSCVEAPDQFNQIVMSFLQEISGYHSAGRTPTLPAGGFIPGTMKQT
ncbi:MAG: alpha/beta hydrolase [Candidatus Latescibacterota bacterium]